MYGVVYPKQILVQNFGLNVTISKGFYGNGCKKSDGIFCH